MVGAVKADPAECKMGSGGYADDLLVVDLREEVVVDLTVVVAALVLEAVGEVVAELLVLPFAGVVDFLAGVCLFFEVVNTYKDRRENETRGR
jgi:hypothetical protein